MNRLSDESTVVKIPLRWECELSDRLKLALPDNREEVQRVIEHGIRQIVQNPQLTRMLHAPSATGTIVYQTITVWPQSRDFTLRVHVGWRERRGRWHVLAEYHDEDTWEGINPTEN